MRPQEPPLTRGGEAPGPQGRPGPHVRLPDGERQAQWTHPGARGSLCPRPEKPTELSLHTRMRWSSEGLQGATGAGGSHTAAHCSADSHPWGPACSTTVRGPTDRRGAAGPGASPRCPVRRSGPGRGVGEPGPGRPRGRCPEGKGHCHPRDSSVKAAPRVSRWASTATTPSARGPARLPSLRPHSVPPAHPTRRAGPSRRLLSLGALSLSHEQNKDTSAPATSSTGLPVSKACWRPHGQQRPAREGAWRTDQGASGPLAVAASGSPSGGQKTTPATSRARDNHRGRRPREEKTKHTWGRDLRGGLHTVVLPRGPLLTTALSWRTVPIHKKLVPNF